MGENLSVVIMVVIVVVVVVVVVVIPVTISVPAMVIFAPPAMAMLPAILAGFVKLTAVFGGFWAVPAVVFHGFMEPVVGPCDTLLAVIVVGTKSRRAKGEEKCAKGCTSKQTSSRLPSKTIIGNHVLSKIDLNATPGETRQVNAGAHDISQGRAVAMPS
jgi:hypothetical protein